ncbi:unnamed protein product [Ilex paraguariensis]|uniref:Glyoxysomal processing protease, glyoxysomal n=1 Tax=Ilex paraguariensis TaxID=185542 RepID=A0ABC8ULF7_9AQUA
MDPPEIVDIARKFAVMVRIQGPDPKALKMRKHAFHNYHFGKTTLSASGMLLPCSINNAPLLRQLGGAIDTQSLPGYGLVLTVASVIEPFLSQEHRENVSQAKPELIPGVQIDIMVEAKKGVDDVIEVSDKGAPHWLPTELLTLVDIPVSSIAVQSLIEASSGSLEHGWEVGWSLASYSNGPQAVIDAIQTQRQRQKVGGELINPSLMGKSTARIALLGVSSTLSEDLPNLNTSSLNRRGDLLLTIGSPFGVLSPVHFFNSLSMGSIANCYPPSSTNRSLLTADIRCLPGMEGSPVFGEYAQLIGILTRPLRQRTSGAEIQLVIPWEAIASACSDLLQEEPHNARKGIRDDKGKLNAVGKTGHCNGFNLDGSFNHTHGHPNSGCRPLSFIEKSMSSICLIAIDDGAWASGVLLNNQGLILTNAHLLEPWRFRKAAGNGERNENKSEVVSFWSNESVPPGHENFGGQHRNQDLRRTVLKAAEFSVRNEHGKYKFNSSNISHKSIRVRLDHTNPWIWCDARVVYVSKGPLDIALLQLEFVPDQLCPIIMDFRCPSPGSKAYVIGHGLFGPRCDLLPSACHGVVAKVVKAKRLLHYQSSQQVNVQEYFPAIIETTAAVHPGGSGGAVINSDGHMIGLVTSNARHGGGTVIPNLNFSISCAALKPVFKFSRDMQCLSLLEDLDKPDEHLSSVWELVPPLASKPGPSLPLLLPGGDDDKDMKGSRFAKFIAERHELFKKETHLSSKVESLSTKFIPSKL